MRGAVESATHTPSHSQSPSRFVLLGAPESSVATEVIKNKNDSPIIWKEVDAFISRDNLSLQARYYGALYLTELKLSRHTDTELAWDLIQLYVRLLERALCPAENGGVLRVELGCPVGVGAASHAEAGALHRTLRRSERARQLAFRQPDGLQLVKGVHRLLPRRRVCEEHEAK